ncbi:MAG: toprim domain-containing protein [Eggerthellaceae bacterium]|nr:toprim domain-containing protein [Eggerthellaceae bacterium]
MAARVSERDRDALKGLMPDILRDLYGITALGRAFKCPSPDHDDSDPSAHYYESDQAVHCFGCGRTWDVFDLVGMRDGIDGFRERAEAVAAYAGYRLEDDGGLTAKRRPRNKPKPRPPFEFPREAGAQDVSSACFDAFCAFYEQGNEVGRRYLRWRGLDDADIARFGLGFARNPKAVMSQFRVYEPEALGYIVIPFWNRDFTEVRYCMARTVSRGGVRNKEWRPKGVASPLYNEWMLSASLPVVYVTEGLIDAMALAKATGKHAMALGGIGNAKRFSQVVYHTPAGLRPRKVMVCMDEDAEGRKAAAKIAADLSAIGVPRVVLPPYPGDAKDADEWLCAMRGEAWDYEEICQFEGDDCPLYVTRWRDGRI